MRILGQLGMLVFTSLFFMGCGQLESTHLSKSKFIRANGVFSGSSLEMGIAEDSDSPYPIVEVQKDWGETDEDIILFGEPLYSTPEEIAAENQGDNGIIMRDPDLDVGLSPMIEYKSDENPKARACTMPDTDKPGVEYQIGTSGNYTGCTPCAVFDYKSNRCLKINVVRKKPKRRLPMPGESNRKGFLNVGTLLMGLAAISLVANLATPTTQYTPTSQYSPPPTGGGTTPGGGIPIEELGLSPNDLNCPLVIDVGPVEGFTNKNLELTSPTEGILFDIRGRKSNHTKLPISWTNNPRYKFLVLPTKNGQVLGIDQMFGNHTFGPDGKFSSNGFEALAKHDGVDFRGRILGPQEGMITSDDPVFHQLRLWTDTNFDGFAQPEELATLQDFKIESIDLDYDENFYERDVYGNEAIFKSVVNFKNGKMGMVFDLWFADGTR